MCLQVPAEATEGTACVRLGDVYSLVVDTYATQGEWAHALDLIVDMQDRGIATEHFIPATTLRDIYKENGMDAPAATVGGGHGSAHGMHGAFGVHAAAGAHPTP